MSSTTPATTAPALQYFSLSQQGGIAHLVLNRPQAMNTMNAHFWRELDAILQQIHLAGQTRVLVLSSTGKHFSAGMALDVFSGGIQMDDQSPEGRAAILDTLAARPSGHGPESLTNPALLAQKLTEAGREQRSTARCSAQHYCLAVRTLRGRACGALVRNGLMSSPPRRV